MNQPLVSMAAVAAITLASCGSGNDSQPTGPTGTPDTGSESGGSGGSTGGSGGSGGSTSGSAGAAGVADGGSEAEAGEPVVTTALDGVYRISSYTQNASSCDAEGPSILDSLGDDFVTVFAADTASLLYLVSCGSVAECQALPGQGSVSGELLFSFSLDDPGSTTVASHWTSSGAVMGGTDCVGGGPSDIVLSEQTDGSLRLEERKTVVSYPAGPSSSCDSGKADEAAAGQPCNEYTVLTAAFEAAL